MMSRSCLIAAFGLLAAAGLVSGQEPTPSRAQAALDGAAKTGKYTFVLFYRQDDQASRTMRQSATDALATRAGQAELALALVADPNEQALVTRWGLSRSPMPLLLAVAPNGAVTGAFPLKVTAKEVEGAFVSTGMAECLKAAQANKLTLLCVKPVGLELPQGVRDFKADAQYGPATAVVSIRSDDASETGFLEALGIKPSSAALTALLVPPGNLLGTFDGTVTKTQIAEKLKAGSACCPGGKCGPNGCCPPPKAPAPR